MLILWAMVSTYVICQSPDQIWSFVMSSWRLTGGGHLGLLPCEVGVSPKVSGYQEP